MKRCSISVTGKEFGGDGQPWYHAVFEIPSDEVAAKSTLEKAAQRNGFDVTAATEIVSENVHLQGTRSQTSSRNDLNSGPVKLLSDIYKSSIYSEGNEDSCGVEKVTGTPKGKTTVGFTVSLPKFKGR